MVDSDENPDPGSGVNELDLARIKDIGALESGLIRQVPQVELSCKRVQETSYKNLAQLARWLFQCRSLIKYNHCTLARFNCGGCNHFTQVLCTLRLV